MSHADNATLTTGEIARLCNVNFRTVIRWAERGLLPAYRLPGRGDYRIKVIDLRHFLTTHSMPLPEQLRAEVKCALIVDDEPAMASAIARVLRGLGYETHIATNGFEAGLRLKEVKPQLMTLDLHMPGLDGFGVLAMLRTAQLDPQPRILVVTGDNARADLALTQGADAVVTKPFTQPELIAAIEQLLAG